MCLIIVDLLEVSLDSFITNVRGESGPVTTQSLIVSTSVVYVFGVIAKRRGSTIEEKTHAVKLMKDGNLKKSEIECRTGVAPSTMRLAETHLRINGYSIPTHERILIMSVCVYVGSSGVWADPHSFALMMN